MDKTLDDILKGLPDKPPRSRLAPYADLIDELRQRGWTYRDIAGILGEKCEVEASVSNLHHFVMRRATAKLRTVCEATDGKELPVKCGPTAAPGVPSARPSDNESHYI